MGVIAVLFIAYTSFKYSKTRYMSKSVIYLCMQAALALPLILSPVLFPWYLLPLVPLLALRPNIYLLAWLLLMPMTYEVLGNFLCCQQWQPALWPVVLLGVLYVLTLLGLIYYGIKKTSKMNHIDNS
ncbi:hypothetical protein [Pseudoalteromonas sp. BSi20652]|uniref:hypothetical protein n=1 Tax=Pseudoalteromonas sp. BSi20652 TaxID=388384 RepID=UPI001ED981DD|nr:hypothetical protein [Pseudoalteromonas sp. BSi20652]